MKSISLLFSAGLFILLFTSCQKETDPIESDPVIRIKTYTEEVTSAFLGHVMETFNVGYDANNRLTSMVSTTTPGSKFVYEYIGEDKFTLDIYQANAVAIHQTFYINSLLLIDSTIQYNNTQDTSTEKYHYNSARQLVKKEEFDYSASTGSVLYNTSNYTYDSNGNMVTESDAQTTTTYSYDTVILNTITISPLYFPASKQLPTKSVSLLGGISYKVDHVYTFDSDKRLISDKAIASSGDVVIKSYTYY